MTLSIISGSVSHVSSSTTVSGQMYADRGTVRTTHKLHFRVNGRSAVFSGTPNVADGDVVTLAGIDKGGEFKALALRNESTGVAYPGPTTLVYVGGILFLLLGIPFSVILIGIPFAGFGAYLLYAGYRNQQANQLLQASPRPSVPAAAG